MIYKDLKFPTRTDRPFFYTSFVATIDGKIQVKKPGYWPIGSKVDFQTFTELRAHADAIIDGKNTALQFGKNTIQTIKSQSFQNLRKKLGKTKPVEYIVVTASPNDSLYKTLGKPKDYTLLKTHSTQEIISYLNRKNHNHVFIDGGPTLLHSFLAKDLVDEVFLTIAPKIFGGGRDKTLTMVEGELFEPKEIKNLKLLAVRTVKNEVFLHYKVQN